MNKTKSLQKNTSVNRKVIFINKKLFSKLFDHFFIIFLLLTTGSRVFADNLAISNVMVTGQNSALNYTFVQFDISWNNSWRTSDGPSNWDAAWIYIKYRKKTENTWNHATLNWANGTGSGDGHTEPTNTDISSSNDNGAGGAFGVFIHRDANMLQGSVNYTGVKLQWNYGVDNLEDGDSVEVCVCGIEMVYVPTASFFIGSGSSEISAFYTYPATNNPFQITSEDAITVEEESDHLYYPLTLYGGDQTGTIPAAFPKGYKGFYCMKYSITQEQYVMFLNMLTREQQNARTGTSVTSGSTSVINRYVMSNTSTVNSRNGIRCDATIHNSDPINFYCDLDGDGTPNEDNDGQNIACNFLSWADLTAYLSWSALRPMTELEYEKACRGHKTPVAKEYAWGSTYIKGATGISNSGLTNETASNEGNCVYNNAVNVQGPLRVGSLGQGVNTRVGVGASYYGIMELSGNLWERTITIGNVSGRSYTGIHGKGAIDDSGDANTINWPNTTATGTGLRGGGFYSEVTYLRVSDRSNAARTSFGIRYDSVSGRGIRAAP